MGVGGESLGRRCFAQNDQFLVLNESLWSPPPAAECVGIEGAFSENVKIWGQGVFGS